MFSFFLIDWVPDCIRFPQTNNFSIFFIYIKDNNSKQCFFICFFSPKKYIYRDEILPGHCTRFMGETVFSEHVMVQKRDQTGPCWEHFTKVDWPKGVKPLEFIWILDGDNEKTYYWPSTPFDLLREKESTRVEWKEFHLPRGDKIRLLKCKDPRATEYKQDLDWSEYKKQDEDVYMITSFTFIKDFLEAVSSKPRTRTQEI